VIHSLDLIATGMCRLFGRPNIRDAGIKCAFKSRLKSISLTYNKQQTTEQSIYAKLLTMDRMSDDGLA